MGTGAAAAGADVAGTPMGGVGVGVRWTLGAAAGVPPGEATGRRGGGLEPPSGALGEGIGAIGVEIGLPGEVPSWTCGAAGVVPPEGDTARGGTLAGRPRPAPGSADGVPASKVVSLRGAGVGVGAGGSASVHPSSGASFEFGFT